MAIEGILIALNLEQVCGVGEEGQVSEGEVVASEILGLGQASLQDVQETIQLLSQSSALRLISSLAEEGRAEEELDDDIDNGARVGLVGGEPGLNSSTSLQVSGEELIILFLRSDIASDGTRLEQGVVAVNESRDLSKGLVLGDKISGLMLALGQINRFHLPLGARLLESSDDSTSAGRSVVTQNLVGRHDVYVVRVRCVGCELEGSELQNDFIRAARATTPQPQNKASHQPTKKEPKRK